MGDFTNITLDGKPLAEVLRQQRLSEVQEHFATEEADLRRKLARGRSMPVPLAAGKRGRKPIEVRSWTMAEVKGRRRWSGTRSPSSTSATRRWCRDAPITRRPGTPSISRSIRWTTGRRTSN
jgi:hypothetical protein